MRFALLALVVSFGFLTQAQAARSKTLVCTTGLQTVEMEISLSGEFTRVLQNGLELMVSEMKQESGTTTLTAVSFDPMGAITVSLSSEAMSASLAGLTKTVDASIEIMGAPGTLIETASARCSALP
jgi:hypothetical protein